VLARPLEGLAAEYAPGDEIPLHQHPFAQLLFASSGVMTYPRAWATRSA
jgi:quercetin dioxygenase-like cupin family protein